MPVRGLLYSAGGPTDGLLRSGNPCVPHPGAWLKSRFPRARPRARTRARREGLCSGRLGSLTGGQTPADKETPP